IHRGSASRTAASVVLENWADFAGPELLAGHYVQGQDVFLLRAGAHRIEPIADNGRSREPNAGILIAPKQLRPSLRPRLEQAGFLADIVPVRTAPLRPVSSAGRHSQRAKAAGDKEQRTRLHPKPHGAKRVPQRNP